MELSKAARKLFAKIGAEGGKAGTGKAKSRGDSDYYKALAKKAAKARKKAKKSTREVK